MKELILTCIVKKELRGGYSSLCPELDVASRGDTIEEARENLQEAVRGHLQTAQQEGMKQDILEQLGIAKKDLKGDRVYTTSFSTPLAVELPV